MSDRSAWWRTGAGVAAWLALALAASGAAWAAVAVVGDESQPAAVSVATRATDPTSPPPSDPASTSDPGATGAPPAGVSDRETLTSPGGTVSVACTGPSSIKLVAAVPNVTDGWGFAAPASQDADEVEVEFTDGDEELRTRARCEGGTVQPDVETD